MAGLRFKDRGVAAYRSNLQLKKLRLYLDTSVFGGVFDTGFDHDSKRIFDAARQSKVIVLICELILEELRLAPAHV